jgi:hypothetical protein
VIRAGLRRLLVASGLAVGIATLLGLVIGPAIGSSIQRSISVGYMLGGCFVMMIGLAVGLRGWGSPPGDGHSDPGTERVASAGLLIGIGTILLFLGVGLDPRSAIV